MKNRRYRTVAVLIGIFIAWGMRQPVGLQSQTDTPATPEVGTLAPDFTLPDLEGKTVRLSEMRGKVVFLTFWATWCPACQFEMSTMEPFYQHFKDQGLTILAVSIDQGTEETVKQAIAAFRTQHGSMTFPVLLDPTQEIMDQYQVAFIPTHFYLDRQGRIRGKYVGPKDWRDRQHWKLFEDLLAER